MGSSDGVSLQSFERFGVGTPYNGLSCEMEDKLRSGFGNNSGQTIEITNIALDFASKHMGFDDFVEVRVRWRWQADARDFRAKFFELKRKPGPLEAGVARDEDSFVLVKGSVHVALFSDASAHLPKQERVRYR